MRTIAWLGMLAVLGAVGCGSPAGDKTDGTGGAGSGGSSASGGAPSQSPTSISETEICPTFIADACRAMFKCPELAKLVNYPDEASCRSDLPCRGLGDFEAELEAGYITWDAKKAATCHDFLVEDLCGAAEALLQRSLQGVLELCPDSPAVAQQAATEPCIQDPDCIGASQCVVDATCAGSCVPLGAVGDVCSQDSDCLEGLDCIGICAEVATVGVGELCTTAQCDDTTQCDLNQNTFEFVCVALLAEGETCSSDFDCLDELNCLEIGDAAGTCEPLQEQDSPCTWNSDCADGLACVGALCGDKPTLGEACDSFLFGGDNCAAPYICNEDVCKQPKAWDESCGAPNEICAEGLCEDGSCVPRRPNGAICQTSNECRFRSCIDGLCVDPISCRAQ